MPSFENELPQDMVPNSVRVPQNSPSSMCPQPPCPVADIELLNSRMQPVRLINRTPSASHVHVLHHISHNILSVYPPPPPSLPYAYLLAYRRPGLLVVLAGRTIPVPLCAVMLVRSLPRNHLMPRFFATSPSPLTVFENLYFCFSTHNSFRHPFYCDLCYFLGFCLYSLLLKYSSSQFLFISVFIPPQLFGLL